MQPTQEHLIELQRQGYCILRGHLPSSLIDACRGAFWPQLLAYLGAHPPNRGTQRHFLPMPFEPPCFTPEFFFDPAILQIARCAMDNRIVADQWGCDVPLLGSVHQSPHADYQRPLFPEAPALALPAYALVVSFALLPITPDNGPIEIAPGTHLLPRDTALEAVAAGDIPMRALPLEIGDVLIRHPHALHRGSPNITNTPRPLVSLRYVRRWYADDSREVHSLPRPVWESLSLEQKQVMRFPIGD
jgi:ectoine hydroxylase-related dioxygenase (phytanoyl-CoA dioxygenase family)